MRTGSTRRKGVASQRFRDSASKNSMQEWTSEGLTWNLPSGKGFAEYALRARFFTPSIVENYQNILADRRDQGSRRQIGGDR